MTSRLFCELYVQYSLLCFSSTKKTCVIKAGNVIWVMESKRKSEGGPAKIWRCKKYSAGITNGEGSVVVLGFLRFWNQETDRNLFFVVFVCLIFRFSFPLTLPFSPEPSSDFGEPKLCQMGRAKTTRNWERWKNASGSSGTRISPKIAFKTDLNGLGLFSGHFNSCNRIGISEAELDLGRCAIGRLQILKSMQIGNLVTNQLTQASISDVNRFPALMSSSS